MIIRVQIEPNWDFCVESRVFSLIFLGLWVHVQLPSSFEIFDLERLLVSFKQILQESARNLWDGEIRSRVMICV